MKGAIKAAVVAACGAAVVVNGVPLVFWENDQRPYLNDLYVILSWVSKPSAGAVEVFDEITQQRFIERSAPRVQIAVESFTQGDDRVMTLAERCKVLLQGQRASAALAVGTCAVARIGDVTRADYKADKRMVARALFELTLNAASELIDADADAAAAPGAIEKAQIAANKITSPSGDPTPFLSTPFDTPET